MESKISRRAVNMGCQPADILRGWLLPRVLELTCTAWDLGPFARACLGVVRVAIGYQRIAMTALRAIGGAIPPIRHFPTPRDAVSYIPDTIPIVRRKDQAAHGSYRTKDTILALYDQLAEAQRTGTPFVSPLDLPPGEPACCHAARNP